MGVVMRLTARQGEGKKASPGICSCVDFRVAAASAPPNRPSLPPFSTRRRAVRADMRRINHLRISRSATPDEFLKPSLPTPALSPADKPVIDPPWRAIFGRTLAPAATALYITRRRPLRTRRSAIPSLAANLRAQSGSISAHSSSDNQNKSASRNLPNRE